MAFCLAPLSLYIAGTVLSIKPLLGEHVCLSENMVRTLLDIPFKIYMAITLYLHLKKYICGHYINTAVTLAVSMVSRVIELNKMVEEVNDL